MTLGEACDHGPAEDVLKKLASPTGCEACFSQRRPGESNVF
jgi:hypothetical protein